MIVPVRIWSRAQPNLQIQSIIKSKIVMFKVNKDNITATLEEYLYGRVNPKDMSEDNKKDLIQKISDLSGVDSKIWQIDRHDITANIWTVNGKFKKTGKLPERWSEAVNKQLKVKIFYKRIAPDNYEEFKNDLISAILHNSPSVDKVKHVVKNGYLLLEDIPDHHLGRLSYGKETGDNYDIKIAYDRYNESIDNHIDEAKFEHTRRPIEKTLFVLGNDFFNYDYAKPTPHTSNGTPQESDVRFQKMFNIGSNLVIKSIEKFSEISPVKVIVIPGNHDEQTAFYLGAVVQAYFQNNKNVEVITSPTLRKYEEFGVNMLGFSHGQYEKFERLFANMSFEEQLMWGRTQRKYMFTGHLHHKETKIKFKDYTVYLYKQPGRSPKLVTEDTNGVMFDRLMSLSSNDYYEASRGYVHIKGSEAILFDKVKGKVKTFVNQLNLSIHKEN